MTAFSTQIRFACLHFLHTGFASSHLIRRALDRRNKVNTGEPLG